MDTAWQNRIQRIKLYPYNPEIEWRLHNFGPIWIPAKGSTIALNKRNIVLYRRQILFENPTIKICDSTIILQGKELISYTFTHDYYFMLGDNFYESFDSRYWGFVPDVCIIGKVTCVLFSLKPETEWYRAFKWDRVLTKIN